MAKKIDLDGLEFYKGKENAMVTDEYSSSKTYALGAYAYYAGTLYRCTTAITTAEAWTAGHWTAAKLADDVTSHSEKIGNLEKLGSSYVFVWKRFTEYNAPVPTGWGTGYYERGGGSSKTSTNYIRTRTSFNSRFFDSNDKFAVVTPPTGYFVRVQVKHDTTGDFIEDINTENVINKVLVFPLNINYRYNFTVGTFNGDSGNYVTDEFVSTCVLRIFRNVDNDFGINPVDYIWNSEYEFALKLPFNYLPVGKKTKLMILCHGLTYTVGSSSWSASSQANKFAEQGFAVMDVNRVTTQDWCNPALIKKYVSAVNYIVEHYNVEPCVIFGLSMGSLIGLCLSITIPGIKANVISGIRLDFEARYDECTAEQQAIIDANLGFTNGFDAYIASPWCKTAFNVSVSGNENLNPINFPPTFFLYGDSDTLTTEESLAKAREMQCGGTIVQVKEYTGDHTAMCNLTAGTSFDDAVDWLNLWS